MRRALAFYEQAAALDPVFAQAWARIAIANAYLYSNSAPSPDFAERARQASEKALALAPNRPEAYEAVGEYKRLVLADFQEAQKAFSSGMSLAPGNAEFMRASTDVEIALGQWDLALKHLRAAQSLDPRSSRIYRRLGSVLLALRRYPEAREAIDVGLTLSPDNMAFIENRAMTFLGEGDLAGARAYLAALPNSVVPTELVAYLAAYWDLGWVLTPEQQELLLRLSPSAFDDDRANWALSLVQVHWWKGDAAGARKYAEEARTAIEEQLRVAPDDAQRHVLQGLALAYLGRSEEAIREGRRGVDLHPLTKDANRGAYFLHQLVRIYILAGDQEKAIDNLERLLQVPYFVSPAWLTIDPNFDPLRKNPRFQKLVANVK